MPKSDVLTEKEDAKVICSSDLGDGSRHRDEFGDPMHREFASEFNGLRLVGKGGLLSKLVMIPLKLVLGY